MDTQRQQVIMGTFASISLEEKNKKEIQKGFKLLKEIEKSLSSYDKKALLYKLNKNKREKNIFHGIIALSGDIQVLYPTTLYIDSPFGTKPFVKLHTLHPNISNFRVRCRWSRC